MKKLIKIMTLIALFSNNILVFGGQAGAKVAVAAKPGTPKDKANQYVKNKLRALNIVVAGTKDAANKKLAQHLPTIKAIANDAAKAYAKINQSLPASTAQATTKALKAVADPKTQTEVLHTTLDKTSQVREEAVNITRNLQKLAQNLDPATVASFFAKVNELKGIMQQQKELVKDPAVAAEVTKLEGPAMSAATPHALELAATIGNALQGLDPAKISLANAPEMITRINAKAQTNFGKVPDSLGKALDAYQDKLKEAATK